MSRIAAIFGRLLLALLFIVSGANKLMNVAGTEQMIQSVGLPGGLAVPTGIFEVTAGLLLAIGFMVRLVAPLLFVFVAAATLYFHNQFADPDQGVAVLKNLSIMGGLLMAFAYSQMWSSYHAIRTARDGEIATHDAEQRLHEAEVRTARAEALAEAAQTVPAGGTIAVNRDGDGYSRARRNRRRWFDW